MSHSVTTGMMFILRRNPFWITRCRSEDEVLGRVDMVRTKSEKGATGVIYQYMPSLALEVLLG